MTEKDIYKKAKKRVREKKEFYTHLGIYLVAIPFFFAINYLTEDSSRNIDWWAFYPTLGWGLGIAIHYFSIFGLPGRHGDEWEERQLKKEINKLHRKNDLIKGKEDHDITVPEDELELKEFKKLRDEWDDRDFV